MDAIDYAEAAGDLFFLSAVIGMGLGAFFAMQWWFGQAGQYVRDAEGAELWR